MNNTHILDTYERQTGSVLRVEPGRLVIRVKRDESECGGCHSCAVKSLCRGRDSGHMDLPVSFTGEPPAKEGDTVHIAYKKSNAAIASLVIFLPALAGLIIGGIIGYRMGDTRDAPLIIGCLAGFFGGIGISFVLSKCIPSLRPDVRLV